MRVQWWWGTVSFVPILIAFFVICGQTDGFQSPADVEGDRAILVSVADQNREEAERVYASDRFVAERRYAEEMPTAVRWSERYWGVPFGGVVTVGLFGVGVALTFLTWLLSLISASVNGRANARAVERKRAHELALAREKTAQKQLEQDTALLLRPLPPPSKKEKS